MGSPGYVKVRNKWKADNIMERWCSSHSQPQDLGVELAVQLIRYATNLPALDFATKIRQCSTNLLYAFDETHTPTFGSMEGLCYIYTVVFGPGELTITVEYEAFDEWNDGPVAHEIDKVVSRTFTDAHAFLRWATQWEN